MQQLQAEISELSSTLGGVHLDSSDILTTNTDSGAVSHHIQKCKTQVSASLAVTGWRISKARVF